jgi:hypothetical protein
MGRLLYVLVTVEAKIKPDLWQALLNSSDGLSENDNNSDKDSAVEIVPPIEASANTSPVARFVTDVTIPDGTKLAPSEKFVKTWTMRNDGQCNWPVGSRLVPVGGDDMTFGDTGTAGVLVVHDLDHARAIPPGQQVDVSIELQAPSQPGHYIGHFRMQQAGAGAGAGGHCFGHRVWVDIIVTMPG